MVQLWSHLEHLVAGRRSRRRADRAAADPVDFATAPALAASAIFEATALLISLVVAGMVIFDGVFNFAARSYPLEYLCIPVLLWAAYRFGPREASAATLVLAGTAIWGTLKGFGPFARDSHNESLLLLQTFIGVVGVTTMGLATAFAERRVAEEQTRLLAASDPLTGLGNYRKLIDVLESEMRRSSRTGRSFRAGCCWIWTA